MIAAPELLVLENSLVKSPIKVHAPPLASYCQTAGKTRNYQKENNGAQAGDPARGAKAIIDAVTSKNPPLHFLLGALAYQRATAKLDALRTEFEKWREVTLATDFQ